MTTTQTPTQVAFIVPPGVHLLDMTGPAQLFYEASTFDVPLTLHFCNLHTGEQAIKSSSALILSQLEDYNNLHLQQGDLVIIPGLDAELLLNNRFLSITTKPFQQWLIQQHQQGVYIASVCTGAFLLAETGLLDNKPCTTHWNYLERFAQRYPRVQLQPNRLFVKSDNIYSSAGVASGIDLSLFILEELFGARLATQVAKEVVIYMRRSLSDPQLSPFMQHRNHLEDRIHQVQDILSQTLHTKWNIEQLAAQVHMSGRNLTRLFRKTTNISIGQYINQLRIAHARQLLKEGNTMQATAADCGLKSTNQLRQLLKMKSQHSKPATNNR